MSAEGDLGAAFVDGWVIAQVLGEGAFSEVRLLMHSETGTAVAAKVTNLARDVSGDTKREVVILRMLKHENVIGFVGQRTEGNMHYIFLEYASGGELFDRIEPDVGMPESEAQNYFRQLVTGVEYLHSVGVTHRDLKPENLILTETDVLKIADFGLSTVFRLKGVERKMTKRCGTLPYTAPEVFLREYDAPPADIWSCGIILVALLTGRLPWDEPMASCQSFADWKECRSWRQPPWTKVHNVALSLLRCVLHCQSEKRATIERIKAHQWFTKDFSKNASGRSPNPYSKRLCFKADRNEITCASQPEATSAVRNDGAIESTTTWQPSSRSRMPLMNSPIKSRRAPLVSSDSNKTGENVFSFSQPAVLDNLLISSQSQPSQQSQQNVLQKLVRRMTRFVVSKAHAEALDEVGLVCNSILEFTVKRTTAAQLTISAMDCRRTPLVFKATAYGINGKTLLDFRLSRGDGLEFKRTFVRIRELLAEAIDNEVLNSWTNAAILTAV